MDWYLKVLRNYVGFSGRARRKEYWMFALFTTLVTIGLVLIDMMMGNYDSVRGWGLLSGLYTLAVLLRAVVRAQTLEPGRGLSGRCPSRSDDGNARGSGRDRARDEDPGERACESERQDDNHIEQRDYAPSHERLPSMRPGRVWQILSGP